MAINLKTLQPHKVSRDLSGYITYIYGPGGAGKTTFGSQMPKPLLLAFEKGYNALPGVLAQDVTTWGEMKQILRQLDDPEVKDMYASVVIDTVDIASQLCEKYLCSQLGIENIGDGGWGVNGWAKVKKEWEQTFRSIAMKGYAVVFISHSKDKTFTRKDKSTYNQVVPSCSTAYNEIIKNMADLEGYIDVNNGERSLVLRSVDDSIECKSRFSKIAPVIPFSYNSLVKALNDAIDAEALDTNGKFVTAEREAAPEVTTYNYEELRDEFDRIVTALMEKSPEKYTPLIKEVTGEFLGGKEKRVSETTPDQAELIFLINQKLTDKYLK